MRRDGTSLKTWDLSGSGAIARTVLGKYVCPLEPSSAAVPETFLKMNALALAWHDPDFAVNGFGPEPHLAGALLERRLPSKAPGDPLARSWSFVPVPGRRR